MTSKRVWTDAFGGGGGQGEDHVPEVEMDDAGDSVVDQEAAVGVGQERASEHGDVGIRQCYGPEEKGTCSPLNINLGLDRHIENNMVPSIHSSVGAHVPSNIRDKIASGQFIELESLLSTQGVEILEKQIVMNSLGELVVKPKAVKKAINDIESWTEAMLVYTSIYLLSSPEKAQDIIKYISTIRLGAKRHGGMNWSRYDQQFRLRLAADPMSMSFGKIDYELWLIYMGGNDNNNQAIGVRQANNFGVKKCYDFNYRQCFKAKCFYRHVCLICDHPHPFKYCFRNRRGSSFSWRAPAPQGPPRSYFSPNRVSKQQLSSTKYML